MGMQSISTSPNPRWLPLLARIRARIFAADFCARHRVRVADFTRERRLTFPVVTLFLLQKTTKSIQRHLHAFFQQLWPYPTERTVTAGGWTQARAKLSPTAFSE